MFIGFFFHLRHVGLKVTISQWQTLLTALERGHAESSLNRFYVLARAICCRSEMDFDTYDIAFSTFFDGLDGGRSNPELARKIDDWLRQPLVSRQLTHAEKEQIKALNWDELHKSLLDRLKEQHERHDGGNKWIGTSGTSPFGHSGWNPRGIRIHGESLHGNAVQIAAQRSFKNFRSDLILDTRQVGLALKKLNHWVREGPKSELDLEATIQSTAKNAGELDFIFRSEQKNHLKILLLMDVGGSMTQHSLLCEQIFSAANHSKHFKEFRYYYFHNCPYDYLYRDMETGQRVMTKEILKTFDPTWMLIVLGDAAMAPSELTEVGGAIDYFEHNREPGVVWLDRIRRQFPCAVWLNPEPPGYWHRPSNQIVRSVFKDMFPMSLDGLDKAIACLKKQKLRSGHFS